MHEFRNAVIKLYYEFAAAIAREHNWNNLDKIFVGYLTAQHQLYEERSKAQCNSKVFSNGTDPVGQRSTVDELLDSIVDQPLLNLGEPTVDQILDEVLEHSEDELIFEDNYQMSDEYLRNLTDIVRVYTLKCYISSE